MKAFYNLYSYLLRLFTWIMVFLIAEVGLIIKFNKLGQHLMLHVSSDFIKLYLVHFPLQLVNKRLPTDTFSNVVYSKLLCCLWHVLWSTDIIWWYHLILLLTQVLLGYLVFFLREWPPGQYHMHNSISTIL